MYQLYAYPNTYSMGVHLLLEETGVPYRIIDPKVNPQHTDAEFSRVSPHRRVPAIVLPNGRSMCESGAIALHLADSLCNQKFTVDTHSADRGSYLQWLFYLSSTLQPDVMIVFHPEHYFEDNERQAALIQAAQKRLARVWAVLENEYQLLCNSRNRNDPWLFGASPTAVDFSLATVLLWPECFPSSSQRYPMLNAMLKALSERVSYNRIMPWHKGLIEVPPCKLIDEC